MNTKKQFKGKLLGISAAILGDADLQQYPYRASLALQVERMITDPPGVVWVVDIELDYNTADNPRHISMLTSVIVKVDR